MSTGVHSRPHSPERQAFDSAGVPQPPTPVHSEWLPTWLPRRRQARCLCIGTSRAAASLRIGTTFVCRAEFGSSRREGETARPFHVNEDVRRVALVVGTSTVYDGGTDIGENGRKTGEPRVTPLQYERANGTLIVASARENAADWICNVLTNPHVEVRVGRSHFSGIAETCLDPPRIADFLELLLRRHAGLVGDIMRLRGVSWHPDRSQLEAYASRLAMVTITPIARSGR